MQFGELTKYIDMFAKNNDFGHWEDDSSKKTRSHYVVYSEDAQNFEQTFKNYVNEHTEIVIIPDSELVKQTGMSGEIAELFGPDVSGWNGQQIISLINFYIGFQLIGEGALLETLKNGTILKCLIRLKELDGEVLSGTERLIIGK